MTNPLVPTVLEGVGVVIALAALAMALTAFVSMARSDPPTGWRFLAWALLVFLVPVLGAVAWFASERRRRT